MIMSFGLVVCFKCFQTEVAFYTQLILIFHIFFMYVPTSLIMRNNWCMIVSNSQILGASSLLLVFSYPLMKRLTFWVTASLSLSFSFIIDL